MHKSTNFHDKLIMNTGLKNDDTAKKSHGQKQWRTR